MNEKSSDFIREIINADIKGGRFGGRVATRFPPEPNGYLHIGHAKSVFLNYGIASDFGGTFTLRFDDTNPEKEEEEYVKAIIEDVKWLGADWGGRLRYASDYFEKMYELAEELIKKDRAYVDDLSPEDIRRYRGTLTRPGKESPFRSRSTRENLNLFRRMRGGEFPDGAKVLRAKIDMSSPNLNMRDPVIYRILHSRHQRTGDKWCIYPMYDFAHCIEDSVEGITHSICTLEFEDHRPLYDWFLKELEIYRPRQIEFARLNMSYTVMSKRKLLKLVEEGRVSGWDDPRMPTVSGLRRRGYPPEVLEEFCRRIGVAKANSTVDISLLEFCARDYLNSVAPRVMAVLDPVKVVIENYPRGKTEELEAVNNPEDPSAGTRMIPFSGEIYIERQDFMENPPRKFFRLSPGREVRLKHAYYITCREVIKDPSGEVKEIRCRYDPLSKGGETPDKRKVRGTLHWVSVPHAVDIRVRLYDRLFREEDPLSAGKETGFEDTVNPESLKIMEDCKGEPSLGGASPGQRFQFLRKGYFAADTEDAFGGVPVFNQTVSLRDTWARISAKNKKTGSKGS